MNNRITRTAALALLGTALLAPGTASADPTFSATVNGAPYFDAEIGRFRQQIDLQGSGCLLPTVGGGHMGEWISTEGDPWLVGGEHYFDIQTDENGTFAFEAHAILDPEIQRYHGRIYCATQAPTSLDDEAMLWVSPEGTMTMNGEDAPPVIAMGNRQAASSGSPSLTDLSFDPDALPLVDRIGIPGDVAAELKQQVDRRAEAVGRIQRMYAVFLGRRADPQGLDYWVRQSERKSPQTIARSMMRSSEFQRVFGAPSDGEFLEQLYQAVLGRSSDPSGRRYWGAALSSKRLDRAEVGLAFADSSEFIRRTAHVNYVSAAFQALSPGRANPSAEVVDGLADRLAAGELKVTIVEAVALSLRDADWWAARG
jgi:hypothetical protein